MRETPVGDPEGIDLLWFRPEEPMCSLEIRNQYRNATRHVCIECSAYENFVPQDFTDHPCFICGKPMKANLEYELWTQYRPF